MTMMPVADYLIGFIYDFSEPEIAPILIKLTKGGNLQGDNISSIAVSSAIWLISGRLSF